MKHWLAAPLLIACGSAQAQELTDQQLAAFRAARTVRVIVKQSYKDAPSVKLPFEETARALLRYTGLSIVPGDDGADLTLRVEAEGAALGRYYRYDKKPGGVTLYSGASVRGSVTLAANDGQAYSRSFGGENRGPQTLFQGRNIDPASQYAAPAGAPFTWGKFPEVLSQVVAAVYGIMAVAPAFVDEDEIVRSLGMETLATIEVNQAASMCLAALREPNPTIQQRGADALDWLARKKPAMLDLLRPAAADREPRVRQAAVHALGLIDDPRTADTPLAALKDPDRGVQASAVRTFAHYRYDSRATAPLISMLEERDAGLRREAAAALGRSGGPRVIEALLGMLDDRDQGVRYAAHESLKRVTRQNFGDNRRAWQRWWDDNKRVYVEAEAQLEKLRQRESEQKR